MDDLSGFKLDEASSTPLWAQLKRRLTYLIKTGAYAFNDQLPTVRELSSSLGVAYNTVSKVYRDLERDGLIRTKQGSGTFSIYRKGEEEPSLDEEVEALAVQLAHRAHEVGMTREELVTVVERLFERGS